MGNFQKLRVWQIANEIGYINDIIGNDLVDECDKISAMLAKLIRARINK
jgi:hypothetical protein